MNRLIFVSCLCFALTGAASCAASNPAQSSAKSKKKKGDVEAPPAPADSGKADVTGAQSYILGAEDVITITMITGSGAPQNISQIVRPDGFISVPLIGELQASGATPVSLGATITQKLKDAQMYVDPNVTVQVTAFNSRRVFCSGDGIGHPGSFALIVPTKVSEAIPQCGGFRDFANTKKVRIVRKDGKIYYYNDKEVSHGKNLKQDILLEPGDHIYVD